MDQLIRLRMTGPPLDLAHKLGISKRMVHEYIAEMRGLGAPIAYSKPSKSYIYTEPGRFRMSFRLARKDG